MPSLYDAGALESIMGFKAMHRNGAHGPESRIDTVPVIPPLAFSAIALWCASAASYVFMEDTDTDLLRALIGILDVAAIAACIVFLIRKKMVFCVVLFLVLGCVLGTSGALMFQVKAAQLPEDGEYEVVLRDDPKASSRGSYAAVTCNLNDGRRIEARAFFNERTSLLNDARIRAECVFSTSSDEYLHSNYMSNLHTQVNIASYEVIEMPPLEGTIYQARQNAISVIHDHGGDQAGLLQALLCGYRPTMTDDGLYESYKRCGIAHIVAVSGAHLAIVTMALGLFLKALRVPRLIYVGASLFFVFAYLIFAGMPISAIRAAVMCSLFLASGIAKRRNATLNSLGVCVMLFIALDPSAAVSISLFLSAASTFGIVMFAGLFSAWAAAMPRIVQDAFAAPLSMTAASNIATLPFSISVFGMLPLVAPLANILVAPVFTVACVLGTVALVISLFVPAISGTVIGVAALCASPMNAVAGHLASIPNSCLDVQAHVIPMLLLSALTVVVLCKFKPMIEARHIAIPLVALFAFLAVSSIKVPAPVGDRIVMLDVGQGDAFVIESEGATLLIDTGNEPDRLRKSLDDSRIYDIEAVSITHSDSDHCEAIGTIRDIYRGAKFLCARQMLECDCRKCPQLVRQAKALFGDGAIRGIDAGDTFSIGSFDIKALWPEAYKEDGGNADSLCLLASLDADDDGIAEWEALFTGDAESEELHKMIAEGAVGDIDILKVGHHGSKASLDDSVIKALKPEYALISAGEGNSYGHPTIDALQALEKGGAQVFRTDERGCVELRFSENGISVTSER